MKYLLLLFVFCATSVFGQKIAGIQLFNPATNDETPIINYDQQLVLSFDDLDNSSQFYRYTIKHLDRNWKDDGLFYSQYAQGPLNAIIEDFTPSFNTMQAYTNYKLSFPNEKIRPKLSGNYVLIVYNTSPEKPLFTKRFVVVENSSSTAINIERYNDARKPNLNQRIQLMLEGDQNLFRNLQSLTTTIMQNNNWYSVMENIRPSTTTGNKLYYQQMDLAFPGNNQFYYYDNKNLMTPTDMVARVSNQSGQNETVLFPVLAYPLNYQYQPDVNGAFYFRRNDNGIEREAYKEGDYSWVYFSLNSNLIEDKELYILGKFNEYGIKPENQMIYDDSAKMYVAKIYLKQGFYNYIIATKDNKTGYIDLGEINGNFWQTSNLYQAITYYKSWDQNYDGAISYGELRPRAN